jgi:hypothetical protein
MLRTAAFVIVTLAAAVTFESRLTAQPEPFVGIWELNRAQSSVTRGTAPKREMVIIVPEPGGLTSTLVMIDENQGRAELHHYRFDGSPALTEGGDARHLTFKRTGARSADITVIRNGQVTATRRMELSTDGRKLSFDASGRSANGTPYTNDLRVYDKVD